MVESKETSLLTNMNNNNERGDALQNELKITEQSIKQIVQQIEENKLIKKENDKLTCELNHLLEKKNVLETKLQNLSLQHDQEPNLDAIGGGPCHPAVVEGDECDATQNELEYNERSTLYCELCGTPNIPQDEKEDHLAKECPEAEKPCKFQNAGCLYKAKDDKMNEHEQSQKTEHLNLMLAFSQTKQQSEKELKETLEKAEEKNKCLKSQLSTHRVTLAAATQDLRAYQITLGKVEQAVGEHRRAISHINQNLPQFEAATSSKDNQFSYQFEEIDEFSRRRHDAVIGKTPSLSSPPFYVGCIGNKATSYDGSCIWKIDEFSRWHHDAVIAESTEKVLRER